MKYYVKNVLGINKIKSKKIDINYFQNSKKHKSDKYKIIYRYIILFI